MLLFVLSMNPLSYLLNQCSGYKIGRPESRNAVLTHLLFVDDLKTFDMNRKDAELKLDVVTQFTRDVGMQLGSDKCAYLSIERGKIKITGEHLNVNGFALKELGVDEPYKYLGIDEDVEYRGELNKEKILKEYYARLRKIWRSELNSRNKVQAHNTFATPLLLPTFGILNWTKEEVEFIDKSTRKHLTMNGSFHRNSDIDRLYAPRNEAGRGLNSILDLYYQRLITLAHHVRAQAAVNRLFVKVCEHEAHSLLRYADELMAGIGVALPSPDCKTDQLSAAIKAKLQEGHIRAWKDKPMHGYNKRQADITPTRDISASNGWTRSLNLTSHLEGYLCAIQEQEIYTRYLQKMRSSSPSDVNSQCRHCGEHPETITHIVGSCSALSSSLYLPIRHNAVAKTLFNEIIRLEEPEHSFVNPPPIMRVGSLELWWDVKVATTPPTEFNRPDIVMFDNETKQCKVIEVSVPLDCNVAKVEVEKRDKYAQLIIGLQRLYPTFEFEAVPVVLGATGLVTGSIKEQLGKIGFKERKSRHMVQLLQERALIGTIKIVKSAMALKK